MDRPKKARQNARPSRHSRASAVSGEAPRLPEQSPVETARPVTLPTPASRVRVIYTEAEREAMHEALCEHIANGDTIHEALRKVILDPETGRHLAWSTVCRWHHLSMELASEFARARQDSADLWASRAVDEALHAHDSQIGRLRFEAAKWKAGVTKPRVYGNKVDVTSDGQSLSPIVALPASVIIAEEGGPGA